MGKMKHVVRQRNFSPAGPFLLIAPFVFSRNATSSYLAPQPTSVQLGVRKPSSTANEEVQGAGPSRCSAFLLASSPSSLSLEPSDARLSTTRPPLSKLALILDSVSTTSGGLAPTLGLVACPTLSASSLKCRLLPLLSFARTLLNQRHSCGVLGRVKR